MHVSVRIARDRHAKGRFLVAACAPKGCFLSHRRGSRKEAVPDFALRPERLPRWAYIRPAKATRMLPMSVLDPWPVRVNEANPEWFRFRKILPERQRGAEIPCRARRDGIARAARGHAPAADMVPRSGGIFDLGCQRPRRPPGQRTSRPIAAARRRSSRTRRHRTDAGNRRIPCRRSGAPRR